MLINFILFATNLYSAFCYTNKKFTILQRDPYSDFECKANSVTSTNEKWEPHRIDLQNYTFPTVKTTVSLYRDPVAEFENVIRAFLYGRKAGGSVPKTSMEPQNFMKGVDELAHMPTGGVMRASTYHNKSAVHLPFAEYIHRDHAYLNITRDYMQTAVDAFAILLYGSITDILRLPSNYVLNSARSIAMMRISREKLAVTWSVVKGNTPTDMIPYETLEKFRPLFKYINGKEMARLNLTDNRILSYIGTHPDLNRHQVGVITSRYLQVNRKWMQVKYLNMMNNLLCGLPAFLIRQIPRNSFLLLTHQVFHHVRACEPLQRRLYLQMMMKTQALGKSYSWNAQDVFRLGLLLTELDGPSLGAINPRAMAGISSKVMLEMPIKSLRFVNEIQQRYIRPESLNVMAKKLNEYYKTFTNCGCRRFLSDALKLYLTYYFRKCYYNIVNIKFLY